MRAPCFLLCLLSCVTIVVGEADPDPLDPAILLAPLSIGCRKATDLKCPRSDITFWLYTRDNTNGTKLNQFHLDSLDNAPFGGGPLKVIVHGFTVSRDSAVTAELRPAYFARGEYNIVAVDWAPLCESPCYHQAVKNIPTVALCVAQFVNAAVRSRKFPRVHVMGHSLGAHVAFQASRNITRLDRITGFDVAYPMFHDDSSDLIKGKADFIDVYHSNCGVKGRLSPDGHLDVYFNDGVFMPGCPCESIISPCSHDGAVEYYIESIANPQRMVAFPCDGWEDYKRGTCPVPTRAQLVRVGEMVDTSKRGLYMMFTNAKAPYLIDPELYTKNGTFNSFKDTADSDCVIQYDLLTLVEKW